jgi:hypothetical protein
MYVYQSVYRFEKKSQLSTSDKFSQTVAVINKEREREREGVLYRHETLIYFLS